MVPSPESQTSLANGLLTDWHAMSPEAVVAALQTDATMGLAAEEVARRQQLFGPNALPEPPPRPFWRATLRQMRSPLVVILLVAGGLASVLGHWGDALVIGGVILFNALLGALQEGRAERSMAALRRLSELHVRVLRNVPAGAVAAGGSGIEQVSETTLAARDLVPGDVVLIAAGDAVAADMRLIEAAGLQVIEAALTGESVPVTKTVLAVPAARGIGDRHSMLFAGTHIAVGRARAVVVATGTATQVGQIARMTESARESATPLEQRLERFGRSLAVVAVVVFCFVMVLGLWRGIPLDDLIMVAIGQMVSLVPEGLPVAMTIALAVGMQRMAASGAIVRRLSAVETLGSTTVICSDKTGTLTRNEMTVVALWLPSADSSGVGRLIAVSGTGYSPAGVLREGDRLLDSSDRVLRELLTAAVCCNDARWLRPTDGQGAWALQGDPTEGALLVLSAKAGMDPGEVRQQVARCGELPFDAEVKLMATAHCAPDGAAWIAVKGAPEAVLRLTETLDLPQVTAAAREASESLAAQGLRVLAIARIGGALEPAAGFDGLMGRAHLLGLVGQIDPPREEARRAVVSCRAAGIRPVLVTGDHALTGLAIARDLGIASAADRAVDGEMLASMNDAELAARVGQIAVFARVQPAQKLRIVAALQERGEVVAMTGDGVNDAPALARADVGVAMGLSGTEVAKGAAKIVITDDDFATIVRAVEQGRVVYGNVKKLILYLFSTSIDEVLILLAALLAGLPLPLLAVQILWINIVTEGTVTVNLVMDPPGGDEMRRSPTPREDRLIDAAMLRRLLVLIPCSVVVTFGWYALRVNQGLPIEQVRTETFTLLAICQWFNVMNCRSATQSVLSSASLSNPWLLGGLSLSVALQLAVLYWPPLAQLMHTVALTLPTLALLVVVALPVLLIEEFRKLLARRRGFLPEAGRCRVASV